MNLDKIREVLSQPDVAESMPFELLRGIAEICNQDTQSEIARELIIRALNVSDCFSDYRNILNSLVRQVGLFPYVSENELSTADKLAYEFHRADGLPPINGKDVVFHREQVKIVRKLLSGSNIAVSAPTSFGKSLIIDALIASGRYNNIAIIVPTIALVDETRRRLNHYRDKFKLITHMDQCAAQRNIYVLTQERAIDRSDIANLDLLVIDEFYKLDPKNAGEWDRSSALNHALYKLFKVSKQIYMLGPHIDGISEAFEARFGCRFLSSNYNTVVSETEVVSENPDRKTAFVNLCKTLNNPTIVYCKSLPQLNEVMSLLINSESDVTDRIMLEYASWIQENYHPEWSFAKAIRKGIVIHHGRLPRSVSQFNVELFIRGWAKFLICTSSLIEGVNTTAKNIVIYETKKNKDPLDWFTFKNIQGRSGRMGRHFIGKVYLFDPLPSQQDAIVNIPILEQPLNTPLELLVQLDGADLSDVSGQRVAVLKRQSLLSLETIRANSHLSPEDQIAIAIYLSANPSLHDLIAWSGMPEWGQLCQACDLVFHYFFKGREPGVATSRQLAYRLENLRKNTSMPNYLWQTCNSLKDKMNTDEAIEFAFYFRRRWAGHNVPRWFGALDRIQREIYTNMGLAAGSYEAYIGRVESAFKGKEYAALEEYGLPIQITQKLSTSIPLRDGLDNALRALKSIDPKRTSLNAVERVIFRRARLGM